nr:MlaD family protein [Bathymodiolus platifrons methanotrophic gill symbiont]
MVLKSPRLGSVKVGNTVSYRQIIVGEVGGFQLANNSQYVLIDVYIADKYASLVKSNSKFWHASGVQIDFGILSGAEFHTESVENIVLGGIAFATPNEDSVDSAKNGQVFKLYQRHKQKWLDWTPEIALSNQAHGNKVNN